MMTGLAMCPSCDNLTGSRQAVDRPVMHAKWWWGTEESNLDGLFDLAGQKAKKLRCSDAAMQ